MATTEMTIKAISNPVSFLYHHQSRICPRVSKHMERSRNVANRDARSHHLPRMTVVVPMALLGFPRASEPGGDRFREDQFGEEGAGVV